MSRNWLLVLAIAWLPGVAYAATANTPASLCSAKEKVVFGCNNGPKIISLCALTGTGTTRLRYAYGTSKNIELEISQNARPDAFYSGITSLSGGGIDYVRVRNGAFSYVLYTGMTRGWTQDGWVIEAHGSAVSHHICKRSATGPDVWAPVYSAKLLKAPDQDFQPPEWIGRAPTMRTR